MTSLAHISFNFLNLYRLEAVVTVDNIPSCRSLERAGFTLIGHRNKSHIFRGNRVNESIFELLKY